MDLTTILIIVLLVMLLGGGWYGRGRWYGRWRWMRNFERCWRCTNEEWPRSRRPFIVPKPV